MPDNIQEPVGRIASFFELLCFELCVVQLLPSFCQALLLQRLVPSQLKVPVSNRLEDDCRQTTII
jgi:hypothetical protein